MQLKDPNLLRTQLFLDGVWIDADQGATTEVRNPATGALIATVPHAGADENRLPYGLAAYAFTRSLKTAHMLSQRIETGMLWINQAANTSAAMPFGGIKDSGYGSEGGHEALDAYLVPKAVSIAMV